MTSAGARVGHKKRGSSQIFVLLYKGRKLCNEYKIAGIDYLSRKQFNWLYAMAGATAAANKKNHYAVNLFINH